jgi:hypothetical protein
VEGARELVGVVFYPLHLVLFFLGPPSLAILLVGIGRRSLVSRWFVVAAVCAVLALALVLMQYHVAESLYGVEGLGGPYSHSLAS